MEENTEFHNRIKTETVSENDEFCPGLFHINEEPIDEMHVTVDDLFNKSKHAQKVAPVNAKEEPVDQYSDINDINENVQDYVLFDTIIIKSDNSDEEKYLIFKTSDENVTSYVGDKSSTNLTVSAISVHGSFANHLPVTECVSVKSATTLPVTECDRRKSLANNLVPDSDQCEPSASLHIIEGVNSSVNLVEVINVSSERTLCNHLLTDNVLRTPSANLLVDQDVSSKLSGNDAGFKDADQTENWTSKRQVKKSTRNDQTRKKTFESQSSEIIKSIYFMRSHTKCKQLFDCMGKLKSHVKDDHGIDGEVGAHKLVAKYNGVQISTHPQVRIKKFDIHSNDLTTKRFFVCSQSKCDKVFNSRKTLHSHTQKDHKNFTAQDANREVPKRSFKKELSSGNTMSDGVNFGEGTHRTTSSEAEKDLHIKFEPKVYLPEIHNYERVIVGTLNNGGCEKEQSLNYDMEEVEYFMVEINNDMEEVDGKDDKRNETKNESKRTFHTDYANTSQAINHQKTNTLLYSVDSYIEVNIDDTVNEIGNMQNDNAPELRFSQRCRKRKKASCKGTVHDFKERGKTKETLNYDMEGVDHFKEKNNDEMEEIDVIGDMGVHLFDDEINGNNDKGNKAKAKSKRSFDKKCANTDVYVKKKSKRRRIGKPKNKKLKYLPINEKFQGQRAYSRGKQRTSQQNKNTSSKKPCVSKLSDTNTDSKDMKKRSFPCRFIGCNESFASQEIRRNHVSNMHNLIRCPNPTCWYSSLSLESVNRHFRASCKVTSDSTDNY